MGNCQAADVAVGAVVIQHPSGGRVERAHGAVSAADVMAANPGHYVAAVVVPAPAPPCARRRLKLLRPDDTLALGGVYRLVSFEEVLREFVSKRQTTLMSPVAVAAASGGDGEEDAAHRRWGDGSAADEDSARGKGPTSDPCDTSSDGDAPLEPGHCFETAAMADSMVLGGRYGLSRHGHWRPALPSIAEGSVVC